MVIVYKIQTEGLSPIQDSNARDEGLFLCHFIITYYTR